MPSASAGCARQSKRLITIGACATAGGIQALRNFADVDDYIAAVYASPDYIRTLATSTPIAAHVPVDFELRGCPINKHQLLEVISALLAGRKPQIAERQRLRRLQAARHALRDGGARHALPGPGHPRRLRRDLPGLSGAAATAASARRRPPTPRRWPANGSALGADRRTIHRAFRTFNAAAEPFRKESEAHGDENHPG